MAFKHASGGHYMLGKPKGDVNLNLINWLQQEVLSESVSNLWRRKKAGVSLVDKLMVLTLNLYLKFDSMLDGEGNGNPLQYSCLENPMDGGAWWAAVHGVVKSPTWLSNFPFTFHFHALEKEMATHSSVLAWRIPGTGEPGGLPSMGSHRVKHDCSDLAAVC